MRYATSPGLFSPVASFLGRLHALDIVLRRPVPDRRALVVLGALLSTLLLAHSAAKLPVIARFELFLAMDYGANLSLQYVLDQGLRPTVDFFYPYGLLPLLVGRVWFALFGRTPHAYLALVAVTQVAVGYALAWCILALRSGWPGALLIVTALPFTVPPTYANVCHALETVLLISALALQARGRRSHALALAGVALFTKPSMAYIYGAVLVVCIVVDWLRHRREPGTTLGSLLREFAPAAAAVATLALLLAAWFGPDVLLRSLFPVQGAQVYAAQGFGFFRGHGRRFWWPEGATVAHYLGTPRGFWLAATITLTLAAILLRRAGLGPPNSTLSELPRTYDLPNPPPTREFLRTTAVLHWSFLALFFGAEISWLYYAFILVLGVAALGAGGLRVRRTVLLLAFLALLADRTLPREYLDGWRPVGPRPRVAGLWTDPEGARAWTEIRRQCRGERPLFLALFPNAYALYPDAFAPPVDFLLNPGLEHSVEADARARQVRQARVVVVPGPALLDERMRSLLTRDCPALAAALADFRPSGGNAHYTLYRRVPGPSL